MFCAINFSHTGVKFVQTKVDRLSTRYAQISTEESMTSIRYCFANPLKRLAQRYVVLITVGFFAVGVCSNAHGGTISWRSEPIRLQVKDIAVVSAIEMVMRHNRVPVVVSEAVKGTISIDRRVDSRTLFESLVEQYNLEWAYDGTVVSVVPAREKVTKLIDLGGLPYARVRRTLQDLYILDPRHPLIATSSSSVVTVSGPARYVNVIEETVRQMARSGSAGGKRGRSAQGQQDLDIPELRVFQLRFATAADSWADGAGSSKGTVIPGVATLIKSAVASTPFRLAPSGSISSAQVSSVIEGGQLVARAGSASGLAGIDETGTAAANTRGLEDSAQDSLAGGPGTDPRLPKITADARSNSVLIYDLPSRMPLYERVIQTIDVPVRQIEIEISVVEVSSEFGEELAIRWRGLYDSTRRAEAGNRSVFADVTAGSVALTIARGAYEQLLLDIRARESEGKAQVLSRPRVITRDNLEAIFGATETFQLRLLGRDVVDTREVSTGLVMKVKPRLMADASGDQVEISIAFQDGQLTQKTVDGVPVQSRTQLTTLATVPDMNTLVIGGHLFERNGKDVDRTPILSSIPILGALFRSTSSSTQRRERLIFVTPRIVKMQGASEVNRAATVLEEVIQ
jgi:type III secretion protein C